EDKEALKNLHEIGYPKLKEELNILKSSWPQGEKVALDSIFIEFDGLLELEKSIMSQLVTYEDYDDPFLVMEIRDNLDMKVLPATSGLIRNLDKLVKLKEDESNI